MDLKRILIISLVLFILSLTAVSASDLNGTQVTNSSHTDEFLINENVNTEHLINDTSSGTFDDLQEEIIITPGGSTLYLTRDYIGHENSRILINRDLTIDAQGHTIDCLNQRGCAAFYSNVGTITLLNMRIINGHNDFTDRSGGAIHIEGSSQYILKNCTFENNWAYNYGGAIYNGVDKPLTIIDCTFKGNKADDEDGGAIYSKGKVNIENTTFKSNKAYVDGGAIFANGETYIKNCVFDGNSVGGAISRCFGGAIRSKGTCTIDSSNFTNNYAEDYGGAIYADGNLYITGKTRINGNNAVNYGGAIYACKNIYSNWNVENPTLVDISFNKVEDNGGGIYCEGNVYLKKTQVESNFLDGLSNGAGIYCKGETHLIDCDILENRMKSYMTEWNNKGGGIYSEKDVTIDSSRLYNNEARLGGAIFTNGKLTATNSRLNANMGYYGGGAIYADTIDKISNSVFILNEAPYQKSDGGAIYVNSECSPVFTSCLFERNLAGWRGSGIYFDSIYTKASFKYNSFVDNEKYIHAGIDVFNSGDYGDVIGNWFGQNTPYKNSFKIYHLLYDEDYEMKNYAVLNNLKINDTTPLFVGNTYHLTASLTDNNGAKLNGEIISWNPQFKGGNGRFSNTIKGMNEVSTDVVFLRPNADVWVNQDNQDFHLQVKDIINKFTSSTKITSCENIYYSDPLNVEFKIVNRTQVSYVVRDADKNIIKNGNIGDENSIIIEGLNPGVYTVTITNAESKTHLGSSSTALFTVKPVYKTSITARDVYYGSDTILTLTSEIDGIFNVSIRNNIIQMEVVNGSCVKKLKLNAGEYTTKTIATADEYGIKSTEATFTVMLMPVHMSLKMDKALYPGNISGEITTDVPGIYRINIEFHQSLTVNITNTSYRFSVPIVAPGKYDIYISIIDDNYIGFILEHMTVERGIFQAQLEIEDTPYSQDLIANAHSDIENSFIIKIGDYLRYIYVRESGLSVNLGSNWDVGEYTASLIFEGTTYYAPFTSNITFKVYEQKNNLLKCVNRSLQTNSENNKPLLTEDSTQASHEVKKTNDTSISSAESSVNENPKFNFGYNNLNSMNDVKKAINSSNDSVVKSITNPSSSLMWGIIIIALICGILVVYYKKR